MERIILTGILVACLLLTAGCSTRQVPPGTLVLTATPTVTGNTTSDLSRLPSYAFADTDVKAAYLFATEHPDALTGVECHCGCRETPVDGRLHTRGLIDCFFNENGTYDSHASECPRCIQDTLEAKRLFEKGMTRDAINQTLEAKYEPGAVTATTMAEECANR
jgi:hypothetical protein